ncbi:MAG: hypothetical protein GC168_14490 [Candidatus Hydrogenedens sp.]|nr:hypothetical protein [Candidatus Hydrogenedens sp.]
MRYVLITALLISAPVFAGEVTGTAFYDGTVPQLKPLDMGADPKCAEHYAGKEEPANEVLVLGEGNTLGNVFVEIAAGLPEGKEYPVPEEPAVLTQSGCKYTPRVFGVRAGQKLRIENPDGTLHNVNAAPVKNTAFNRGMPPNVTDIEVVFDQPEGLFPFRCNVHTWMVAYCAVMSHPYFTVTGSDGTFTIPDLPAGKYTVKATHERLGSQETELDVPESGAAQAEFRFSRPSAK